VYSFEPILTLNAVASHELELDVAGIPGTNYAVQASNNLIDWEALRTNVSPFNFVETNTGPFPRRFFRAIYAPQ